MLRVRLEIAIAHEYNSGFNPLQLHCWCYDVLQRIVPSCSDLPLGVSAVPEPHFFTPRLGRLQASEISRDVCFPATQDPFDIGSGSCAPTGGTPEAEIEGETSTPSATFSREGTLTGRPQGEQHRARTFTATALIGRYGTAPASSPKPDPFQGLAPTYSQSFSVLPGCTCSRSHTPLDCARQTRPHALVRRRVVYRRQLLPLSNRQCVQLSR
ncbi:hypothetical protein E1301_Tti019710 [Triplophysa tibetana]|uniref:Uncharacterized protein n=1 Tax=Triplophysa tibetana TaxID=1572043 RepID=A0A5A9NAH0_9TELE|nr:hypothetical protein E1301_Tti019710 [Triplophysa tibetana]